MNWQAVRQAIPLVLFSILALLHLLSFSSNHWYVKKAIGLDAHGGLWKICALKSNGKTSCSSYPDLYLDISDKLEVVRAFSLLSLAALPVIAIGLLLPFREGYEKHYSPLVAAAFLFVNAVLQAVSVGIASSWIKHDLVIGSASFSWSFQLACVTSGFYFVTSLATIVCKMYTAGSGGWIPIR